MHPRPDAHGPIPRNPGSTPGTIFLVRGATPPPPRRQGAEQTTGVSAPICELPQAFFPSLHPKGCMAKIGVVQKRHFYEEYLWGYPFQVCIWGSSLVVPHRSAVDCASTWPTKGLGGAVNAVQYCSKLAAPKDLLIYVVQRGKFPR